MKRFVVLCVLLIVAGLLAGSRPRVETGGITWSWHFETYNGEPRMFIDIDVKDPQIVEVRAWAISNREEGSSSVMVYNTINPVRCAFTWDPTDPPTRVWIEAAKRIGIAQGPPLENHEYSTLTSADEITRVLQSEP